MSPTSPTSSDPNTPPNTPSTDSPGDMSCDTSSPETGSDSQQAYDPIDAYLVKNSGENPMTQALPYMPRQEEPATATYMVSLFHALPFMFRVGPPPTVMNGGLTQLPNSLELAEISHELRLMNPHGGTPHPHPYKPSVCAPAP